MALHDLDRHAVHRRFGIAEQLFEPEASCGEPRSLFEIEPGDGHYARQLQEHGDFGTSPSFRRLFDSPLLASHTKDGRAGDKEQ
jgi:hypothetical protein